MSTPDDHQLAWKLAHEAGQRLLALRTGGDVAPVRGIGQEADGPRRGGEAGHFLACVHVPQDAEVLLVEGQE